ncbi:MAG: hypothetical protein H6677_16355 [Candidatus Obscuribacterales bacterium]|nr:hypothetical protein [Candidatus Obscuribacterales bacterium]
MLIDPKADIKDILKSLEAQLEVLKKARPQKKHIKALIIALEDKRVQEKISSKLKAGFIYGGIGFYEPDFDASEYAHVIFHFSCPPDKICIFNPSFMVNVDFVNGYVLEDPNGVIDPFFPIYGPTSKAPFSSERLLGSDTFPWRNGNQKPRLEEVFSDGWFPWSHSLIV